MMLALIAAATLAATPLATDGHVVAWWGPDAALTVSRPGTAAAAPRTVAGVRAPRTGLRHLDVGRGPGGHAWATYTRCTPGGGCAPWGVDLATGARRSLGVGRGHDAA